jgi:1-acyl-sn-glycerol-3-phosphate acyltransferase
MPGDHPGTGRRGLASCWRALRTGLAFGVFGAGALLLAFGVIPLLRLVSTGPAFTRQVQRVVHRGFRLFEWFARLLGLVHVSRIGFERLDGRRPQLIVANHPTLIDVVLLVASLPQADCIVKTAAWRNPFLRAVARQAGYIPNDQGRLLVDTCVARLTEGRTLLLFPEGTRSPRGGLGSLRRGAAHVALRSGVPLLPVVIRCDPPTLMKGQKWYDVPGSPPRLTLAVGDPIDPLAVVSRGEKRAVAARRLTGAIRAAFEQRLAELASDEAPATGTTGAVQVGRAVASAR